MKHEPGRVPRLTLDIKMYRFLFTLILLGGVVGGAWYYYTDTQERITELSQTNAKLRVAVDGLMKTVERQEEEKVRLEEANHELVMDLRESEEYRDGLLNVLRSHNLTRLSAAKPGLIEKRINDGTKEVFDNFESLGRDN